MRKSGAVLGLSRVVIPGACPRLTGMTGNLLLAILLTIALVACGDDSGTSANDGDGGSEAAMTSSSCSSSQKKDSSSSKKVESSSSQKMASSSSVKKESSSSVKAAVSSSSVAPASSSSKKVESSSSQKVASSSSSVKTVSSSSSVIPASSGNLPSSSSKKVESSSSQKIASSSSSVKASSSSAKIVSSSSVAPASSSSKKAESSSSEYVPYDHFKCLADNWNLRDTIYKQFTDTRNGRSYYYYTAVSSKTGKTVTVMAENLNVGEMVLGENDQNNDAKIERYCYNNDTTYCDEFGGLYQWAEMMQLPSRCNTESCSDLIQENHRGICPEGWRLFTWDDYVIIRQYEDKYDEGISGLRSQCFNGTNTSGFSLIGGGERTLDGKFESLSDYALWFYPKEYVGSESQLVYSALVSKSINESPSKDDAGLKKRGYPVRCVKLE